MNNNNDPFRQDKQNNYLAIQLSIKSDEVRDLQKELNELKDKLNKDTTIQKNDIAIQTNSEIKHQIFEKIEDIGYGERSRVIKVLKAKFYALKEMSIQSEKNSNIQYLIDEFKIMTTLSHPNILKAYGIYINDEMNPPSILLEYCPMSLEQAIKKKQLSKVQIAFSVYQIAEGMKYIHSKNILHKNLKPSNILISEDGMIKICDFKSNQMTQNNKSTKSNDFDDVYSFGLVVYYVVSGGQSLDDNKKVNLEGFQLLAQQLVNACMSVEFEPQITFEIICNVLEEYNFGLFSFSEQENQKLSSLISQYKLRIPNQ